MGGDLFRFRRFERLLGWILTPFIVQSVDMAQVSIYNHHKFARSILKKSRKSDPSLTIELFTDHWKFKGSVSGSSEMMAISAHARILTIPVAYSTGHCACLRWSHAGE
jgi:hypothetical protein